MTASIRSAPAREVLPALIAVGLLRATARRYDLDLPLQVDLVALTGALAVYSADHLLGTRAPNRFRWETRFSLVALYGLVLLAALWTAPGLRLPMIPLYVALSFLYVFPLCPGRYRLQDLPLPRVAAIVGGWAALPFLLRVLPVDQTAFVYVLGLAFFLLPDVLWSDLADKAHDAAAGRPTLAHRLSPGQIRWIGRVSLLLSAAALHAARAPALVPGPLLFLAAQELLPRRIFAPRVDLLLLWPLLASFLPH